MASARCDLFSRFDTTSVRNTKVVDHGEVEGMAVGATGVGHGGGSNFMRTRAPGSRRVNFRHSRSAEGAIFSTTTYGPAFCEKCGTPTSIQIPDGDERERHVCTDPSCGFVAYQNPKVVVGAVCTYKDKVLLAQRAIEPCLGKWGYPQGFLELGETTRQGAARETWEEAGVQFDPTKAELLAIYNLAGMQVQMIYRVELDSDAFEAGHESSDVKFFAWDGIPWDELAFPTVEWGLEWARDTLGEDKPDIQERTKQVTMDGKWKVEEEGQK